MGRIATCKKTSTRLLNYSKSVCVCCFLRTCSAQLIIRLCLQAPGELARATVEKGVGFHTFPAIGKSSAAFNSNEPLVVMAISG